MKGKKFYIAIIGLFIIGIGSLFIYRQQQEARVLEFEGYEISAIESRVDALYNEEKTDIQEDIGTEITELEQIFVELNKKDLSKRSERYIQKIKTELLQAKEMVELQEDISNVYKDDEVVRPKTSIETIEELQTALGFFEHRTIYHKRNQGLLTDAKAQIETIEEARERVAQLTTEGVPNEEVDKEALAELEEFLAQLKDEDLKERLLEEVASVRLALEEANTAEEVALKEAENATEKALDSTEILAAEEEEAEEVFEEETREKEGVETVQETTQTSEPANNTPTQTNNVQTPSSNNETTSSSQPNRTSGRSASNQTSKPNSKPSNSPSNKPSDNQSSNQTNPVEQKPTVEQKYTETKVIKEIPYETVTYESNDIAAGEEIIEQEGHVGQVIETYEVTVYSDGTSSKQVISTEQTEPENRVIAIGTKESEAAAE